METIGPSSFRMEPAAEPTPTSAPAALLRLTLKY